MHPADYLKMAQHEQVELINAFNETVDQWIEALEAYSFEQLCAKPAEDSWSLGQVYKHLIEDTRFYVEQIKACEAAEDHAYATAAPAARLMLAHNSFPEARIQGAPTNAFIPQPGSNKELTESLFQLKEEMNRVAALAASSGYKGKTQHPGLGFFNAWEWLQFAAMHFRHHLRQKNRIDVFLKSRAC